MGEARKSPQMSGFPRKRPGCPQCEDEPNSPTNAFIVAWTPFSSVSDIPELLWTRPVTRRTRARSFENFEISLLRSAPGHLRPLACAAADCPLQILSAAARCKTRDISLIKPPEHPEHLFISLPSPQARWAGLWKAWAVCSGPGRFASRQLLIFNMRHVHLASEPCVNSDFLEFRYRNPKCLNFII